MKQEDVIKTLIGGRIKQLSLYFFNILVALTHIVRLSILRPRFFRGSSTNQHSSPLQHLGEDGGHQTSVRPERAGNDWEWNKVIAAVYREKLSVIGINFSF